MKQELAEKHGFVASTVFKSKVLGLTCMQLVKNIVNPQKKFNQSEGLKELPVIAFSESELWNENDNEKNWILTAGKIENLRIAAQKLHGLEIGANQVFSFWKHIGNPNFGKGYVVGREIREGCIIPTTAGGLCQLSNALYDAALKANFNIIERHKHTQVVKGSLAEQDRDATVKWNYLDLKFSSNFAFRIEVELSGDKLIISYKSKSKNIATQNSKDKLKEPSKLNDCYSCGNTSCYKHPNKVAEKQKTSITTFLLDEHWPEHDAYIESIKENEDAFIVSLQKNLLVRSSRYQWPSVKAPKTVFKQGFSRALKLRRLNGNNVFDTKLKLDAEIAKAMARKIPVNCSHLVVSQNLLPGLLTAGALGGRTVDVLMTSLPIEHIQHKLNKAHKAHPESNTLNDFRASNTIIDLENKGLTKARKIITPHLEIASLFKNKVEILDWKMPKGGSAAGGTKVLFPASTVGRKGCYEMRDLLQQLNLPVVIQGRNLEGDDFWKGIKTERFDGDYSKIGLVVYPAHVENQPRNLLKILSKGIPVIASKSCGLPNQSNLHLVDLNNPKELNSAMEQCLSTLQPA